MIGIEIDKNQLLGIYRKEMETHFQTIEHGLLEFDKGSVEAEVVNEVFRSAHTIKGSSYLLGFTNVGDIAHSIETTLEGIRDKTLVLKKEIISSLFTALDVLKKAALHAEMGGEAKAKIYEFVSVDAGRLDNLMELMSELLIDKEKLSEDTKAFRSMKNLIRNTPLETLLVKLEDDYLSTQMVTEEMQREILNLRLMPISGLLATFPRMVRDLASASGRQIELVMSGEETQLDKKVLDGLKDPFLHIVRNSCDHGIEKPEERKEKGKPAKGTIRIKVEQRGGMVHIEIFDDGRGLNLEAVKQKAIQKNLVTAEKAAALSPQEIQDFIFQPGFSTKEEVSDISGRGVGMDVVKAKVKELQGAVMVHSEEGCGMRILIEVPLTLILTYVQLVRVGNQKFAIPISFLKEHLDIPAPLPKTYMYEGEEKAIFELGGFLGFVSAKDAQSAVFALTSLGKTALFGVGEVIREEQLVVKPLSSYFGKVNCISGAAILPTGEVVLVLDVNDLINLSLVKEKNIPHKQAFVPSPKSKILIIEDALVTREMERAIFSGAGFEVEGISSAEDALILLKSERYDVIVLDVQLTKMDGLEFCRILKADPLLKSIPVIMLSVLSAPCDVAKGMAAGAIAYFSKQDFNQEALIRKIKEVLS
ncbi:MAG: response regulator [Candidatus Saganbacteria bacterium]|nr:response regulator [Candidatus Saganbacteria bacterium]